MEALHMRHDSLVAKEVAPDAPAGADVTCLNPSGKRIPGIWPHSNWLTPS